MPHHIQMSRAAPHIVFMGTPEYAVPYLKGLIAAKLIPIAVISQPDRPAGRKQIIEPTPIKRTALAHNLPILQPEDIRDLRWINKIQVLNPDLIIVVAFGQIIPKNILDIPPKGCLNVHPSLLPRHRGASPLQETILQGDAESGVTIMLMDEKMDHGQILSQEKFSLDPNETYKSLRIKTTEIGVLLLVATIQKWLENAVTPQEQHHDKATFTRLLTRDSGKIDWSHSCNEIERRVRALNPWPGTWTVVDDKRLKILSVTSFPEMQNGKPSQLFRNKIDKTSKLYAACKIGSLRLNRVQLEGKKEMSGEEFARGHYALFENTSMKRP